MDKISKTAPVRAGRQAPGTNLVFTGENRRQRRASEAKTAPKTLPASIWKITKVYSSAAHGMVNHLIYVQRRDREDHFAVWSKEGEGAAPVEGGLLERMSRPTGGEAMIWTDGTASKSTIGGGYTKEAVPAEWEPDVALARVANVEKFNEQYREIRAGLVGRDEAIKSVFSGPEFRQATIEEIQAAGAGLGLLPSPGMSIDGLNCDMQVDVWKDYEAGVAILKGGR